MNRIAYYHTEIESDANICDHSVPLSVNCAGIERSLKPGDMRRIRNDYYLLFINAGVHQMETLDTVHTLVPDTFMLIPPNTFMHHISDAFKQYYWIHFTGSYAAELLKSLDFPVNRAVPCTFSREIREYFESIFRDFLIREPQAGIHMCATLVHLLTALCRPEHAESLLSTIDYITKHYNEEISIPALAEMENLSVSHYRKIFRQRTGMSPGDYLTLQRINTACFYLSQNTMTINEIASLVGYKDPLYFSRIFKAKVGMSPRQYRSLKGYQ